MNTETRYVDMYCVIGTMAKETNVTFLSFENLVELGKRTVRVYNLEERHKTIKFEVLCEYITMYIKTPFGRKYLLDLFKSE